MVHQRPLSSRRAHSDCAIDLAAVNRNVSQHKINIFLPLQLFCEPDKPEPLRGVSIPKTHTLVWDVVTISIKLFQTRSKLSWVIMTCRQYIKWSCKKK